MTDAKKAPGSAATLTGATGGKSGETVSMPHSIMAPPRRQVVSELLECGEANGRPMRQLQEILSGSSREIRLAIQKERLGGVPILSGQRGYWIAENEAEVERFCASMGSRQREIGKVVKAIREACGLTARSNPQCEGQLRLAAMEESMR